MNKSDNQLNSLAVDRSHDPMIPSIEVPRVAAREMPVTALDMKLQ